MLVIISRSLIQNKVVKHILQEKPITYKINIENAFENVQHKISNE